MLRFKVLDSFDLEFERLLEDFDSVVNQFVKFLRELNLHFEDVRDFDEQELAVFQSSHSEKSGLLF